MAETGPQTDGLGLKLALDGSRATVGLDRAELPFLRLRDLELELAEVPSSLDLDGGVEAFRNRATQVRSLVLDIELALWARRLQEALWSKDVPWVDLQLIGEGDHVVLEGRCGRRRASIAHHIVLGPGDGSRVRAHLGPAFLFDLPEPGATALLQALAAILGETVGAAAPRADFAILDQGILEADLVRASLWALLPARGWKMPRLEGLSLEGIQVEADRLVLAFGLGEPYASEVLRKAVDWEREAAEDQRLGEALSPGRRQRLLGRALEDPALHGQILAHGKDVVPDLLYRGVVQRLQGDEEEARACFDRAAAKLRSTGHLRSAAWALLPAGRGLGLEARVARLEEAVALRPDDPQILAELVEAFPRLDRVPAAVRAARRLAHVSSEPAIQVEALLAAGRLLRDELEDPEAARKAFDAALALAPKDVDIRQELAVALGRLGRLEQAIELMDQLVREARDAGKPRRASRLQVQAGRLWAESGDPRRAVDQFRTAFDQDPGNLEALVGYFDQAGPAGLVDTARSLWNGIAGSLPDHGPSASRVFLAAGRLFSNHDRELARTVLARARRADPRNSELLEVILEAEEDAQALPAGTWLEGVRERLERGDDDAAFRILFLLAESEAGPELLTALRGFIAQADGPERLRRLALVADRGADSGLARHALEKALSRAAGPERGKSAAALAIRLYASGAVQDALRVLDGQTDSVLEALQADGSPQARALRLHHAVRVRDWNEAELLGDGLRSELEPLPEAACVQLATDLARAYGALGRTRDRASILRQVLGRLSVTSAESNRLRSQLADAYRMLGDRGGLAELRRQQASLPQTPPPEKALLLMEAARAAMASGEEQQAVEDAEAAVDAGRASNPELEQRALRLLNDLLASKGSGLSGDSQRDRSLQRSGTVLEQVVLERAALAWSDGRGNEAVDILKEGQAQFTESERISLRLAEVLERLGRSAEAGQAYAEAGRRAEAAGRQPLAAHLASRSAQAYVRADELDAAHTQDERALDLAETPDPECLERLLGRARELNDHDEVVRLLELATSLSELRNEALFELAQVHGLGRSNWVGAGEALTRIDLEGRFGRRALGTWLTWARKYDLVPPHPEQFDRLAASEASRGDRLWAWIEGAKAVRARGGPEAAAVARIEAAVRLEPNSDEARRLRGEFLKQSKDPVQRGESLLEDAQRRDDPAVALEGAVALQESESQAARDRAAGVFEDLLNRGDLELVAQVAALSKLPRVRLEALAQLERRAESSERMWACRIARAAVRLQEDLRIDEAAEQERRLDHAWKLLDQLDEGLADELAQLGWPSPPGPGVRLAELGMESSSLAEDGEAYLRWVRRRESSMEDPYLRVALWQAAATLLSRLGMPEAAAEGLEAVRDLAPREVEGSLFELWLGAERFEDIGRRLGPSFARQAWTIKATQASASALLPHLDPGPERSQLLLFMAEDAAQDPIRDELALLEQALEGGDPGQRSAALLRLERLHDARGDVAKRVEIQRARVELEDEDDERIRLRLQLADALEHELADLEGAEAELRAILALEPEHPKAKAGLRALLAKSDRFEELRSELGEETLRSVWLELLEGEDDERKFAATDAIASADPDQEAASWWALAERLQAEDPRRAAVLARVVRGDEGELHNWALEELRARWEQAGPEEKSQLAELMADLVAGPERATMLLAQISGNDDAEHVEQLLLQAHEVDPDSTEVWQRLADLYFERDQLDRLLRSLSPPAVQEVLEKAGFEQAEALLEARARATGAGEDWLEAARRAAERSEWTTTWHRLARVLDDPPHPTGTLDLLRRSLPHAPAGETPPLGPELVAELLGEGSLSSAGMVRAVEGVLNDGGAESVARLVRRAPDGEDSVVSSLEKILDQAQGAEGIDVRMALLRLRPEDERAAAWIDWAFEEAASQHRDRLPKVAEPWLERQLAVDDGARHRAALDRLFAFGPSFRSPSFILASFMVELAAGRDGMARREAEALFDSDAAPPDVRRTAAETAIRAFSDGDDPDARRVVERAWVELCRPETVGDEGDRVVALRALAEVREARGAEPMEIAQPLEAVVGLGMMQAEEIEVRRQLRELWEQAGDWSRAEVHQQALAALTDEASEWTLLAELRTWISDAEGAREALASALAVEPNHPAALAMQFRLAEQDENWDSAVDLLVRLGSRAQSRGRLVRAVELTAEHMPARLTETVRRVLAASAPEDVKHVMESIRPLLSELDEEGRDELLETALQRWPLDAASALVRVALAERLRVRGEEERARAVLRQGLTADLAIDHPLVQALESSDLPESLLEKALGPVGTHLAARQADRAEARKAHAEAIRLWRLAMRHPSQAESARTRLDRLVVEGTASDAGSRARAALESGLPEQALAMLEDAGADTDWTAIRALAGLGRWSDAAERLRRRAAVVEGEERIRTLCALSRVSWEHLGAFIDGAGFLAEAASVRPDHRLGRMATDLYVAAGQPEEARVWGRQVMERLDDDDPRLGSARLGLAGVHLALGEEAEALEILQGLEGESVALRLSVRHALMRERWSEAVQAVASFDEAGPSALEFTAVAAWLTAEHLGDPEDRRRVRDRLQQLPRLDPPGELRASWFGSIVRRLAQRDPELGADLLDAARRTLGTVPSRLHAELLVAAGRPEEAWRLYADDEGCAEAMFEARRANADDAAWLQEVTRRRRNPAASVHAWRELQRDAPIQVPGWPLDEVEPPGPTELHLFDLPNLSPAGPDPEAIRRWVESAPSAAAALEGLLTSVSRDPRLHTYEAIEGLARRLGWVATERTALERLVEDGDAKARHQRWRRLALLTETDDPEGSADHLMQVAEREGAGRALLHRLTHLLRRSQGARAEADAWARFGPNDPTALSRAAVLRSREIDDRRGALATWRGARRVRPDELSFRWGILQQCFGLGDLEEAKAEALDAAELAGRLGAEQAQAAFRLQALRASSSFEEGLWSETLAAHAEVPTVLDSAVAAGRRFDLVEPLLRALVGAESGMDAGPVRGRLRVARARLLERPGGRGEEAESLRRQAAREDFGTDVAASRIDGPEMTLPPLDTGRAGVPLSQLELAGRLEELVQEGTARALETDDPHLRCQFWMEVARAHARSPDGRDAHREALQEAVRAQPASSEAWAELALTQMRSENWSAARRSLARLLYLGGAAWALAELELRAAKVALMLNDVEEAEGHLQEALRKDPDALGGWRGLVEVARRARDVEGSRVALQNLSERLDSVLDAEELARARSELAELEMSVGAYEEAALSLDQALSLGARRAETLAVKLRLLEVSGRSEEALHQTRVELALQTGVDLAALESAEVLGDERSIERLAERLDSDGLRSTLGFWRRRKDWRRVLEALGEDGPRLLDAPEPEELRGCLRALGRIGHSAGVFAWMDWIRARGLVEQVLTEDEPGRFWFAQHAERLPPAAIEQAAVRGGLRSVSIHHDDRTLHRVWAEAERHSQGDQAQEIYRSLLRDAPWDLQLLNGYIGLGGGPGAEWVRDFITRGVERPARPLLRRGLADVVVSLTGDRPKFGGLLGPTSKTAFEREGVGILILETPDFGEIPILRHHDVEANLEVDLGPEPAVWVPWTAPLEADPEAIRFLAAVEWATAVLAETDWLDRAEAAADVWALEVVPDLRAAVDVLGRWGLGQVFVSLDDPNARTHALRDTSRLSRLIRYLVLEPTATHVPED